MRDLRASQYFARQYKNLTKRQNSKELMKTPEFILCLIVAIIVALCCNFVAFGDVIAAANHRRKD